MTPAPVANKEAIYNRFIDELNEKDNIIEERNEALEQSTEVLEQSAKALEQKDRELVLMRKLIESMGLGELLKAEIVSMIE